MLKLSTELLNAMLATGSLKSLLDTGKIYIYSGPTPASADAAIDPSSTLLVTITNNGTSTGLTFDGAVANGVIKKTGTETWSGTIGTSGTAVFYRYCVGTDNGSAAAVAGDYRVQGTIGLDASYDLQLSSVSLVAANVQPIDSFQLYMQQ